MNHVFFFQPSFQSKSNLCFFVVVFMFASVYVYVCWGGDSCFSVGMRIHPQKN